MKQQQNLLQRAVSAMLIRGIKWMGGSPAPKDVSPYGWDVIGTNLNLMGDDFEDYIEEGFNRSATVYSIITYIASNLSRVPWVLYEVNNKKAVRRLKWRSPDVYRKDLAEALAQKAMQEIEGGHPLLDLIEQPNKRQGGSEFMEQMYGWKALTGNAYVYGMGPMSGADRGKYTELYLLPSQHIEIIPASDGTVKHYLQNIGSPKTIDAERVMHLKYFNPNWDIDNSQFYGFSPIQAASLVLQQNNDSNRAAITLMQTTGMRGLITPVDDSSQFTEEQASQLRERLRQLYEGVDKMGQNAITSARLKYQAMAMSPTDLALIGMMKYSDRQLCNIFNVNSALFNDPENKTFNNLKEAKKALYSDVIVPELSKIRDELNRWLTPQYTDGKQLWLDFDTSGLEVLQEDMKEQVDALERAWWITGDEKREAMGFSLTGVPEMNEPLIPANLIPAGEPRGGMVP